MTEQTLTAASNKLLCKVLSIKNLTPSVFQVLLEPKAPVSFQAGQYLQIYLSDSDKRPFSIASAPTDTLLELHIGGNVTDNYASQALAHLRDNSEVLVQVGLGEAYLRQGERPVLLLAGGTGFSYVASIAKTLMTAQDPRKVLLYWGLRQESGLYYQEELAAWQAALPQLQIVSVVQEPTASWQGRSGLVHEVVLADLADLSAYDIYIAGPFPMVGAVRDAFLAQGAVRQHMYADAFAWL
ncbi:MAG: NAD(P)H-flavin reductase [Rheinheimera sp.]|nr:NAD(P)H-flavin reductase [Rheinheimera sp.]